ncbi:hypothetical protein BHE74_00043025 [Ensete ventricosum]|nr:hypothetical protein BHE74_00043025 [Ensete ventricosum]RZS13003.1 hypothetical protein BHM03_00044522 [Ensete ventricosum]
MLPVILCASLCSPFATDGPPPRGSMRYHTVREPIIACCRNCVCRYARERQPLGRPMQSPGYRRWTRLLIERDDCCSEVANFIARVWQMSVSQLCASGVAWYDGTGSSEQGSKNPAVGTAERERERD